MKKISIFIVIGLLITSCTNKPVNQQPLKVAAIYATPLEESWDGVIHRALLKAQQQGKITYEFVDSIQPERFEAQLRSLAGQKFDIIFGDAFSSEQVVRDVVKDYPQVKFVFGSGLGPSSPNLSVFDNWIPEPAYLAGLIAGYLTRSNMIGVVAAFDIPEVNRLINAFRMGILEMNPQAKVRITFINSWFDPSAASEAAKSLIAGGADVIYAERDGAIDACTEAGIPVIGNLSDQRMKSPGFVVTSVVWNMEPTVNRVIELVRTGTFEPENYAGWSSMAKGGAELAPYGDWDSKLDPKIKDIVAEKTEAIKSGKFRVPINESRPVSD